MMNIGVAISGNLTGFSRFYANDEAKKLLNSIKFNFDVHNLVSFLNNGEKLYAIFFSKDVVAVGLITNILDSFRRPGNLVVTVLIPRGYKIVDGLSLSGANALYGLLNDLNDKFYEKNFLNGMINQNPAVLMQDYYTEILSKFRLEPDRSQRKINELIDVTAPNKNTGYVSTLERNIPLYLSSLFRKSYEGYHHIFFASNAPQNIDEPAEEIITYKVRVSNDNRQIYGEVRLDDRIPTVSPQLGEIPIPNQNYTYRQVLNGEAGNEIIGSIENDTIVLTYRFQEEEKTVYFKFYDGANEVPLHVLRPLIEDSNGSSYPLSAESWTFKGEKIYRLKTIKSGNPEYIIEPQSIRLDLQPLREGAMHNVYVSKYWTWTFDPKINNRRVNIKPISITLVNKYTGEKKDIAHVTGCVSERLSGSAQEWEMHIESDYYKSATFPATGPYRLEPKPQTTHINRNSTYGGHGTNVQHGGSRTRTNGNSCQQIKLSGGENESAKEQTCIEAEKKRLIQHGIYAAAAIVCCLGIWWGYTKLFPSKIDDPTANNQEIVTETSATKKVSLRFIDYDGDELKEETSEKLEITFDPSSIVSKSEDGKSYIITYDSLADPSQKIKINVAFQSIDMLKKDSQNNFEIKSLEDVMELHLSVRGSDIKMYEQLEAGINPRDYDSYRIKIKDPGGVAERNSDYGKLLNQKLGSKPTDETVTGGKSAQENVTDIIATGKEDAEVKTNPDANNRFYLLTLVLGRDNKTFLSGDKIIKPKPHEEATAADLCEVMKQLKSGEIPATTPRHLSSDQKKIINRLRKLIQNPNVDKNKLQTTLQTKKLAESLHKINVNILEKESEFLQNQ